MGETEVVEALNSLGENTQEVASNLAKLSIRGLRHSVNFCPIAKFVKSLCESNLVTVDAKYIQIDTITFPLPKVACEFVLQFDNGKFEELEL